MAQSLRIWDQIIATGFLLQAGWLLVTWGGQAIIVCPSSLCGNWKAEVGSPGFLEALKVNFGRELNGSPGEEVAWGRTFKTNRGGKWQGETWLWKVTWSWNSEWKFATFHGSFLWSRIFPSIGAPSNWYIYIIIIIQIYIYIHINSSWNEHQSNSNDSISSTIVKVTSEKSSNFFWGSPNCSSPATYHHNLGILEPLFCPKEDWNPAAWIPRFWIAKALNCLLWSASWQTSRGYLAQMNQTTRWNKMESNSKLTSWFHDLMMHSILKFKV